MASLTDQQELALILQQELKAAGCEYMFDPDETRAWIIELREQYAILFPGGTVSDTGLSDPLPDG